MITNQENLEALNTSFQDTFTRGLNAPAPIAPGALATEELGDILPVSTGTVEHPYVALLSSWRNWTGDRVIENVLAGKYSVTDKPFEFTISVPRRNIEDDQLAIFDKALSSRAATANLLPRDRMIQALLANGLWGDGTAFFASGRTFGKSTITNLTTSALSSTTLEAGIKALAEMKLPDGVTVMNVAPRYLVVGYALYNTAFALVNDKLVSAGTGKGGATDNPNYKRLELRMLPEFSGDYANYWAIFGEIPGVKPCGYQQRIAPMLEWDRSDLFKRNVYNWGGYARGEGFLTLPHLCYAGRVAA